MTRLEDRCVPARYMVSLLSPAGGDEGDTASIITGGLQLAPSASFVAADPTAAIKQAFSGTVHVEFGTLSANYTFSSTAGSTGDPFAIDVQGEQAVIRLEDCTAFPDPDWDYDDRYWAVMVRETGAETVLYTHAYTWTGLGQTTLVTATVTQDKVGYEGLYHWNYHVTNQTMASGSAGLSYFFPGQMEVGDVANISSSLGWGASLTEPVNGKRGIAWVDPGAYITCPDLMPGQSGTFSFTTPYTGIGDAVGANVFGTDYDAEYAFGGEGDNKVPELQIKSVIWTAGGGASGATPVNGEIVFAEKRLNAKKTAIENTVRDKLTVKVELTQKVQANKEIRLVMYDVDDPSANTNNDPDGFVDLEVNPLGAQLPMWDNRGSTADLGAFAAVAAANTNFAEVTRRVSRQPGDNFRVVATIDDIDPTTAVSVKQNDGNRAGLYYADGTAVKSAFALSVKSGLMTVWRTLHIEQDRMEDPVKDATFGGTTDDVHPDDEVPLDSEKIILSTREVPSLEFWGKAFVRISHDLSLLNTADKIEFVHNFVPNSDAAKVRASRNVSSEPEFWAAQLVSAYEGVDTADSDGELDALVGISTPSSVIKSGYMLWYGETIRDLYANSPATNAGRNKVSRMIFVDRVIAHEAVHQFGIVPHTSGTILGTVDDALYAQDLSVSMEQLGKMRSRTRVD